MSYENYTLWVDDRELESEIREKSYKYMIDLFYSGGLKRISDLISQKKLSENFLKATYELAQIESNNTLFRGIHECDYKYFEKTGNTKTGDNVSDMEFVKLRRLGVEPSKVLYAAPLIEKAWEFVRSDNPSILVLYDARLFKKVEGQAYLYELIAGSFKDAVKACVIIFYNSGTK